MDLKELGERLQMIRKHLGISQKQLAKATKLSQPAISRLENGEQVYASALLSVFDYYRDKVSLDHLLDPDLDTSDNTLLYCRSQERRQKFDNRLSAIAHNLEESLEQISALRDEI
jgi:transcriptional regulator with XRE-family HTH domain